MALRSDLSIEFNMGVLMGSVYAVDIPISSAAWLRWTVAGAESFSLSDEESELESANQEAVSTC